MFSRRYQCLKILSEESFDSKWRRLKSNGYGNHGDVVVRLRTHIMLTPDLIVAFLLDISPTVLFEGDI
jgi:hypothetical protein